MKTKTILLGMAAAIIATGAAAAQDAAPAAPATEAAAPTLTPALVVKGDAVETLRADGRFTTLVAGLDATNLASVVKQTPTLTLFAPTDAAFAKLPPAELEKVKTDPAAMQMLLLRHMVAARVDSTKIKGVQGPLPALSKEEILFDGSDASLEVGGATIVQQDVAPSVGLIQVVDGVLTAAAPSATPQAQ